MRYELADKEWAAIKPMLPNKPRGVPRVNDRRVLNGIFWVLRSGAPWRDLPDNFGPYTTCYNPTGKRLICIALICAVLRLSDHLMKPRRCPPIVRYDATVSARSSEKLGLNNDCRGACAAHGLLATWLAMEHGLSESGKRYTGGCPLRPSPIRGGG